MSPQGQPGWCSFQGGFEGSLRESGDRPVSSDRCEPGGGVPPRVAPREGGTRCLPPLEWLVWHDTGFGTVFGHVVATQSAHHGCTRRPCPRGGPRSPVSNLLTCSLRPPSVLPCGQDILPLGGGGVSGTRFRSPGCTWLWGCMSHCFPTPSTPSPSWLWDVCGWNLIFREVPKPQRQLALPLCNSGSLGTKNSPSCAGGRGAAPRGGKMTVGPAGRVRRARLCTGSPLGSLVPRRSGSPCVPLAPGAGTGEGTQWCLQGEGCLLKC